MRAAPADCSFVPLRPFSIAHALAVSAVEMKKRHALTIELDNTVVHLVYKIEWFTIDIHNQIITLLGLYNKPLIINQKTEDKNWLITVVNF